MRLASSLLFLLLLFGCGQVGTEKGGETFESAGPSSPIVLEIRVADDDPGEGKTEVKKPESNVKCYMYPTVEFTNRDIVSSSVFQEDNRWTIQGTLSPEAAQKMQDLTSKNIGKRLVITLDGKVISAPPIRIKIGEKFILTGPYSKEVATKNAKGLVGQ